MTKVNKKKVIDVKESYKSKIPFIIGHSNCTSETLYPTSFKVEGTKYHMVDLAGLHDTGGKLIDFIVSLLNKKLFSKARSVRFLVPFNRCQITEMRGEGIID